MQEGHERCKETGLPPGRDRTMEWIARKSGGREGCGQIGSDGTTGNGRNDGDEGDEGDEVNKGNKGSGGDAGSGGEGVKIFKRQKGWHCSQNLIANSKVEL